MRTLIASFAVILTMAIAAPRAMAQNYDAMAKWTDAKVIRFHVSGDFSGSAAIMRGKVDGRTAKVTDHVEFDFDWDNVEMKLIGKPVIKNFPSKLGAIGEPPLELYGKCPPVKMEGTYEHWTLQSVSSPSMLMTLTAKREMAAGSIPYSARTNLPCGSSWDVAVAASDAIEATLQVPAAMLLEMGMGGPGMEISKDKKSFILKPADQEGWVWTMTPTIVK